MKAVILAAAKKEALFPFSETKPTSMLPLNSEPLLARLVSQAREAGAEKVYIVANHLEGQIQEYFSDDERVEIIHQEKTLGTGAALALCKDIENDLLVLNGDVVVSSRDLKGLVDKHEGSSSDCTVLGTHDSVPEKFGVLSIRDDNVTALEEKPEDAETSLVNTGIYCFTPRVFEELDRTGSSSLTDAVREMLRSTKVHVAEDYWIDIGERRRLLQASRVCREEVEGEIHETADVSPEAALEGKVEVREDAVVEAGAYIRGPAIIGRETVIGPNCAVRKSVIGNFTQLDSCSVFNSLIFEDVIVDPSTHVEDSVIGEGSDLKSCSGIRKCFLGADSFIDCNNAMRGVKTVPDARTDLGEISK